MDIPQLKKMQATRLSPRVAPSKKHKRYAPYEMKNVIRDNFDDTQLMETPVLEASEENQWALVVGPKQPPPYK